jgi:hypothetical protein
MVYASGLQLLHEFHVALDSLVQPGHTLFPALAALVDQTDPYEQDHSYTWSLSSAQ